MTDARNTYAELFKLASASAEVQEAGKIAQAAGLLRNPKFWGALGLTAAGAGIPAYLAGRSSREEDIEAARASGRNVGIGAGLASGMVAPTVLRSLGDVTGLSNLLPGGGMS